MSDQALENLAAEFIERHRRGESPSVDEYASAHPDLAAEIRDLFPTMVALEKLKEKKQADYESSKPKIRAEHIDQLGDFRIIREVGRGGMGIVYEAEQLSLDRRVAVKVLPKQSLLRPKQLDRFQREAMTAARLHHTNIVPVFGVGHDDGYHYIVLQFIDGVGLDEILVQIRRWLEGESAAGRDAFQGPDQKARSSRVSATARSLLEGHYGDEGRPSNSAMIRHDYLPSDRENSIEASSSTIDEAFAQADTVFLNLTEPPVSESAATPVSEPSVSQTAAMDVLSGTTTAASSHGTLGPSYWRSVARLGRELADALAYAHSQRTLHRDVKPGNMLLDADGRVWLSDFGLAKALEHDAISRTGDIVGTLGYMAPEQLGGNADASSDIYSLGVTLYEMLTLQPAFPNMAYGEMMRRINEGQLAAPRRINAQIPRELETIVLKAAAREPASRYRSAEALGEDLQRFLDDRPILARRATWAEHAWRWSRRNPLAAALGALSLMLLIAFAVASSIAYANTRGKLDRVSAERAKVEQTLQITIEALDRIYERFAPDRVASNELTLAGSDSETTEEVIVQPTLSPANAAMLEELIGVFDKLAAVDIANETILVRAAKARRQVGEIQLRLGQLQQADNTLQLAQSQYESLQRKSPDSGRYAVELARIHNTLGEIGWRRQDAQAVQEHAAALRILTPETEPASGPKALHNYEARFELARTYYLLARREAVVESSGGPSRRPGGPRGLGPGPGPLDSPMERRSRQARLQTAIKILEQLQQDRPDDAEVQRLEALCYRELADNPYSPHLAQAISLLESLHKKHPEVADYAFDLSQTYLVDWNRRRPGFEQQLFADRLVKAREIVDTLQSRYPAVSEYQSAMAMILLRQARLAVRGPGGPEKRTSLTKAAEDVKRAETLQSAVLATNPQSPLQHAMLGRIRIAAAELRFVADDYPGATEILEEAASQLSDRQAELGEHPLLRDVLVETLAAWEFTLRTAGNDAEADQVRQRLNAARPRRPFRPPPWIRGLGGPRPDSPDGGRRALNGRGGRPGNPGPREGPPQNPSPPRQE